jgi:hypothetical protein
MPHKNNVGHSQTLRQHNFDLGNHNKCLFEKITLEVLMLLDATNFITSQGYVIIICSDYGGHLFLDVGQQRSGSSLCFTLLILFRFLCINLD